MAVTVGSRLGPYEVLSPLGAGAMGEVYRGRDPRLAREVAIKVLPPQFAADAERLSRFEREARVAGALQHPNILTVFDLGTHDGAPYVVSELLSGQTLRELLNLGPLPARRVIEYGAQIARGLSAAHEQGIVHRDLKPENLFVTEDRIVKILDFGLARLERPATAGGEEDSIAGTLTESGMLLGTAGYMAPEQARGERADHRSDLFALGTVLYEMLTGRRAFKGDSVIATLYAILNEEPPSASSLASESPPGLDRVIHHCLEKRPQDRFHSAHDLAFQLDALLDPVETSGRMGARTPPATRGALSRWRERIAWALVVAGVIGVASVAALRTRSPDTAPVILSLNPPRGVTLAPFAGSITISPDGSSVAYVGIDSSGVPALYLRRLGLEESTPVPDSRGTWGCFWSPDGRNIGHMGFNLDEAKMLKRVSPFGGKTTVLCAAANGRGGAWNSDGIIVFAPEPEGPLFRIPADGGDATPVTALDSARHETSHRYPFFLPDGDHFLYAALPGGPRGFEIYAGSLKTVKSKRIMTARSAAIYAQPGYLVFERDGDVLAQRFDARRLELKGEPVVITDAPPASGLSAEPVATASRHGRLALLHSVSPASRLEVLDRTGKVRRQVEAPQAGWKMGRVSPDGRQAAVFVESELWVVDLERGVPMKVVNLSSVPWVAWSPDGGRLAYADRDGPRDEIYLRSLGGQVERLATTDAAFKFVWDWAPSGHLFFNSMSPVTDWDIWVAEVDGDTGARPLVDGPTSDAAARLSPDGRWLAFSQVETNRPEVFVQSFPSRGNRMRISRAGGDQPMWAKNGRELLFLEGQTMMSVEVRAGAEFRPGTPRPLFALPANTTGVDIMPGGEGFLISRAIGEPHREIRVILEWTSLARSR